MGENQLPETSTTKKSIYMTINEMSPTVSERTWLEPLKCIFEVRYLIHSLLVFDVYVGAIWGCYYGIDILLSIEYIKIKDFDGCTNGLQCHYIVTVLDCLYICIITER